MKLHGKNKKENENFPAFSFENLCMNNTNMNNIFQMKTAAITTTIKKIQTLNETANDAKCRKQQQKKLF